MVRTRRRNAANGLILGLSVALSSCVGLIGEAGDAPTPSDTPGTDASSDAPTTPPVETCTEAPEAPAPLRRMTRADYNNTVRDLLNVTGSPANEFAPDEVAAVFSNEASSLIVSPLLAEQYMAAAEDLATEATRDLPGLLGCNPAAPNERECVRGFIARFGRRAFRRPLTEAESMRFNALYDATRASTNLAGSVAVVVQAALQSPHFLYRPEFGTGGPGAGGGVRLTSYEVASRLSYFLWQSMPDEALFALAEADQLQTREQIEAQARRALLDPRARGVLRGFHDEWLGLTELPTIEKDATVFPEFVNRTRTAMVNEVHAFVDDVFFRGDARLETLFTGSYTFITPPLAALYGLPSPTGTGPQRVELDPMQRAGLLTMPGLLAVNADEGGTTPRAPIVRGLLVRERLLCQEFGDPPPDVPEAPERTPGATRREQLAEHRIDPVCAGCHDRLDPIGLGFEHYDAIGRYVTTESGRPVNATGAVTDTRTANGAFVGAIELARRIARSEDLRDCVTQQWFRYAFGRHETEADACSMRAARTGLGARDGDVRELLVGLVLSESFVHRTPVAR